MFRHRNILKLVSTTVIGIVFLSAPCKISSLESETEYRNNATEAKFVKKAADFTSRMLWLTHDRRFILPNGTLLNIAPSITIPVFRPDQKPFKGGLNSDVKLSWYLYMDFSKMGMAGDRHPWPIDFSRPPFYPFGELMRINPVRQGETSKMKGKESQRERHPKGEQVKTEAENNESYDDERTPGVFFNPQFHYKRNLRKRSVLSLPPPESIHGGERAILMPTIEGLMDNIGFDGRACLLRAVCEIHEYPLHHGYGLFGEMFTLFFSVSRSSYADSHMPEYLKAENEGRLKGDCSKYKTNCTKSIFKWEEKQRPQFTEEQGNEL